MDREKLAENLLNFLPAMFKKLMRVHPTFEMPKQQMGLLFHISKENRKPMSYYSEKMMVPKPNLTVIADKLINDGFVERAFDSNDRRVIILALTKKGEEYINENIKRIKGEMMERLDSFNDKDIERLNELILEMKEIFDRLD
ncbi:MAG TPA: MarR family transcriptional regulator [Clostridia bacterium]|nr:MarR family transcriptional regulator [Clostridia bacterium]